MKGMTRITNLNSYVYEENFKGEYIKIEPGESIFMDPGEAIIFKGTISDINPIRKDDGVQHPKTLKYLKFESPAEVEKKKKLDKYRCNVCGKDMGNKKALDNHIEADHSHLEKLEEKI